MKKVLQEKLEAIQKLTEIEVSNADNNKFVHVPEYSAVNFIMDSPKKKVMIILWPNTVKIVLEVHVFDCFSIFQKSCNNAEDECLHYKSLYERSQQELKDLAEKHKQVLKMSLDSLNFNNL